MLDYCHHRANPATPLNPYQHLHHHPVPSSSKMFQAAWWVFTHGACGKKESCCICSICSMLLSDGLGRFLLQNPLDGQGQRKFCCLSSWVKLSQDVTAVHSLSVPRMTRMIAALIAILPVAPSSSSSWQPYPEASSNHPGVASISLDIITSSTLDTPDSWLNYTRIAKDRTGLRPRRQL